MAREVDADVGVAVVDDVDADLIARLVAHASAARAADGGWATTAGCASDVESSAWILVGAASLRVLATHRDAAHNWLLDQQRENGSWTFRRGPEIATWVTYPALFALSVAGVSVSARDASNARERAAAWIANEHSMTPSWWQRTLARFASQSQRVNEPPASGRKANSLPDNGPPARNAPPNEPPVVLDATLDGFGWARHTFAWVEPTATAMLALAAQPRTRAIRQRIAIGARLLLDRQSSDGGWNYGNKRVLGYDLPGYPDTTGWALLGLEAAVRAGAATRAAVAAAFQRGLTAMSVERDTAISPLPLALEMLARRAARGATSVQHDAVVAGQPAGKRGHLLAEPLAELLATALVSALADVNAGYPMLETRTAVLSLLALHDVDLLALHAVDWPAVMSTTPHASS